MHCYDRHAIIIIYLFSARLISSVRRKYDRGVAFYLQSGSRTLMSTQRDTRGGSTVCFENGVLVLVGLGYRLFRKLGSLLQMVSETR
jgi:hypothetical protein